MGKDYFVKQGECLSSLAKRFGFLDYQTIYNHPKNVGLKEKRLNPNVLFPGDGVFIPDIELKEIDAVTEQKHQFELIRPKTTFRITVKDSDENPFANVLYELRIDRQTFTGTTDNDGKIEEEIPADARKGGLLLFTEENETRKVIAVISLNLGRLDPVEEVTGIQARLNNLGFDCGKVDGILGKRTKAALLAFQEKNGLTATGETDAATREKLRQTHDWQ